LRLLAVVEYDGTDFAGFQLQAHRGAQPRTVQAELEAAILAASGTPARVIGSGRTDAGVHARGQVVHFDTDAPLAANLDQFRRALNAHLPPDVLVHALLVAPDGFHARFSAASRLYDYTILNAPTASPLARRYSHHVRKPLDVPRMHEAAQHLTGTHDFVAFAARETGTSTVRTVLAAQVTESTLPWAKSAVIWHNLRRCPPPDAETDKHVVAPLARLVHIEIEANAFLRHMMRRIAGTLIRVGQGTLTPEEVASIIASGQKGRAGPAAPAAGLCLERVSYHLDLHRRQREHAEDEDLLA